MTMERRQAASVVRSSSSSLAASNSSPQGSSSSALRTSLGGSSISPASAADDPSPTTSAGSHHRPANAPLALFLKASQQEAPSDHRHTEAERDVGKKTRQAFIYSRSDAKRLRCACAVWPEADRIPNMIKFFLLEVHCIMNTMERDEVDSFAIRRVLPLLECQSDEAFYYRLRPGDATRLAMTATIILNVSMKCSLGLLSTWFTTRKPGTKISNDWYTAAARDGLTKKLKSTVKILLEECMRLDEPGLDQVRAIIAFIDNLKSEGSLAGPEAQMWFPRLSQAVEACKLHQEPPNEVGTEAREKHRRLFVSFVSTNWYGATMHGEHMRFPADRMTTIFPQVMQDREQECLMHRFKMGRMFGPISKAIRAGPSDWRVIDDIEDDLQDIVRTIPVDLRLGSASDRFSPYRPSLVLQDEERFSMQLQKHLLSTFYHFLRGLTHRIRFFQHPDIPAERVQYSREICIESAQNIIWMQQELRAKCFSDAWLRGFHFIYFTLEPTVVLVLAALTTLGDAEMRTTTSCSSPDLWEGGPLEQAVTKARSYLAWSQRGADLMASLPMDVTTNQQASQFVERIVTKATNLVDWYETYARSTKGPRMAIFSAASATKHVLCDGNGRPIHIPLFDGPLRDLSLGSAITANEIESIQQSCQQSCATRPSLTNGIETVPQIGEVGPPGVPLSDFGVSCFEGLSFSLPSRDGDEEPVSMFESAPPLEEQIDAWLALLQQ